MNIFISLVIKEAKHVFRDKRTMLILFGIPIVLMLLFGFALRTDVTNVRVVAVTSSADHLSGRLIDALDASEYFSIVSAVPLASDAERLIRNQKADMAIVFPNHFASQVGRGEGGLQIITDASDPNMAIRQAAYAGRIMQEHIAPHNQDEFISTTLLYNPGMESSYHFVPGILGMLLLLICAMMTGISIAKEKERGTMEVLLVSPVRPLLIVIAKAVPYILLSVLVLFVILLMSKYVLEVPISGGLCGIYVVSLLYIFLALSLGLLISTIASTQLVALLFSAIVLLVPTLLLSGMIFPVESMPPVLQWVAAVVPARHYIICMRKLMVMGVDLSACMREIIILIAMAIVLLTLAIKNFKTRLE